ncbi:unnamed protein product, partial [Ectocarpus sp. 4 AP-2014]
SPRYSRSIVVNALKNRGHPPVVNVCATEFQTPWCSKREPNVTSCYIFPHNLPTSTHLIPRIDTPTWWSNTTTDNQNKTTIFYFVKPKTKIISKRFSPTNGGRWLHDAPLVDSLDSR